MAGSRTFDRPRSLLSPIHGAMATWRDLLVLARELRGLDPESARRLLQARGLIGTRADGQPRPAWTRLQKNQ